MRFLIITGGMVIAAVGAVGFWYLITNLTFRNNENKEN